MYLFFFNDTATTEIYTLSLHDALPICLPRALTDYFSDAPSQFIADSSSSAHMELVGRSPRSEEHTSELQSRQYLVCRLLLEKKKTARAISQEFQHSIIQGRCGTIIDLY